MNHQDRMEVEGLAGAGAIVLAALLDSDEERVLELLRQFKRGELVQLRHAFTVGKWTVDEVLKNGDHA